VSAGACTPPADCSERIPGVVGDSSLALSARPSRRDRARASAARRVARPRRPATYRPRRLLGRRRRSAPRRGLWPDSATFRPGAAQAARQPDRAQRWREGRPRRRSVTLRRDERAAIRCRTTQRARCPRAPRRRSRPATNRAARRDPGGLRLVRRPPQLLLAGRGLLGREGARVHHPGDPDEGRRTADVPLAELDLVVGAKIAYVLDFGDDWRVRPTRREQTQPDGGTYPRVLQRDGIAPPQYPGSDED
jgi:hypothetical protein